VSAIINDPILAKVWHDIEVELERATYLHPNYPTDHLRRTLIMLEEAGEEAKETLEVTRTGGINLQTNQPRSLRLLQDELVQTAAMCIRQLSAMEQENRDGNQR